MNSTKRGLGRGLNALISTMEDTQNDKSGVLMLKINDVEPREGQPRKHFDDEKLTQLAESIKQHGIIQPIIVKKEDDMYKIIAGERRWRAAKIAGVKTIPAIEKNISSKEVMEIALIENLQREDLNPIEEAEAYDKLIKEYEMTQEALSNILGKSRPAITNSLRLLMLPEKIKKYVVSGDISSGHARTILGIDNEELRVSLAEEIMKNGLSVRATEELVRKVAMPKKKASIREVDNNILELENKLKEALKTKVKLFANKKRGKITIEYYSNEELERLLQIFGA